MANKATQVIHVRLSKADHAWLKQHCSKSGVDISTFIRTYIEQLRQGSDLFAIQAEQEQFKERVVASYGKIKTMYENVSEEVAELSENLAENNGLMNKLIDLLISDAEPAKKQVTYDEVEARRQAAKAAREANNA